MSVSGLAIAMATSALARERCLSPAEYAADAGLRYHAMLRATALTCGQGLQHEALLKDYQLFGASNAELLSADQTLLENYYAEGDDATHLRETEMQNAEAGDVAQMGAAAFCHDSVPALEEAALDSPREVRSAIADFAARVPGPSRRCK